jgi:hypothetical protein
LYLFIYGAILGFEEEEKEGQRKRFKSREGKRNLNQTKITSTFFFFLQDSLLGNVLLLSYSRRNRDNGDRKWTCLPVIKKLEFFNPEGCNLTSQALVCSLKITSSSSTNLIKANRGLYNR